MKEIREWEEFLQCRGAGNFLEDGYALVWPKAPIGTTKRCDYFIFVIIGQLSQAQP